MLTLTYAMVALSVEQKQIKAHVLELQRQQGLRTNQARFELLITQFVQLDEACRVRNVELYVLPAMREASAEADGLLADIDALTLMGRITLKTVRGRLRQAETHGTFEMDYLCDSLLQYCQDMLKRLTLEETRILPLAQRVISSDEWFDLAARFISHEADRGSRKPFDMSEAGGAFAAPRVVAIKSGGRAPMHAKN